MLYETPKIPQTLVGYTVIAGFVRVFVVLFLFLNFEQAD